MEILEKSEIIVEGLVKKEIYYLYYTKDPKIKYQCFLTKIDDDKYAINYLNVFNNEIIKEKLLCYEEEAYNYLRDIERRRFDEAKQSK